MQGLKYLGWALAGGAIGATVAFLTAPASGQETRRRIARRMEDEKEALLKKGSKAVESAAEFVQSKIDTGKRRLAHVVSR